MCFNCSRKSKCDVEKCVFERVCSTDNGENQAEVKTSTRKQYIEFLFTPLLISAAYHESEKTISLDHVSLATNPKKKTTIGLFAFYISEYCAQFYSSYFCLLVYIITLNHMNIEILIYTILNSVSKVAGAFGGCQLHAFCIPLQALAARTRARLCLTPFTLLPHPVQYTIYVT